MYVGFCDDNWRAAVNTPWWVPSLSFSHADKGGPWFTPWQGVDWSDWRLLGGDTRTLDWIEIDVTETKIMWLGG